MLTLIALLATAAHAKNVCLNLENEGQLRKVHKQQVSRTIDVRIAPLTPSGAISAGFEKKIWSMISLMDYDQKRLEREQGILPVLPQLYEQAGCDSVTPLAFAGNQQSTYPVVEYGPDHVTFRGDMPITGHDTLVTVRKVLPNVFEFETRFFAGHQTTCGFGETFFEQAMVTVTNRVAFGVAASILAGNDADVALKLYAAATRPEMTLLCNTVTSVGKRVSVGYMVNWPSEEGQSSAAETE